MPAVAAPNLVFVIGLPVLGMLVTFAICGAIYKVLATVFFREH